MKDYLKKYVALRTSLVREKATLEARLQQINEALTDGEPAAATAKPAKVKGAKRGRKRAKNKLSLKKSVIQVTTGKALTKVEILAALKKVGYKFSTKDPLNSLNTVLYTGKQFKNNDGKFSAA